MNLMEKEPHDPEIVRTVARMKRVVERWNLDADFRKACESDPEKTLAEIAPDVDPEAFRLLINKDAAEKLVEDLKAEKISEEDIPESYVIYNASVREKILHR